MWRSGGIAPLDRGEWSASRPVRFTPREIAPGTLWIEGWVSLRAGLNAEQKRKILLFAAIEPWSPIPQPIAIPTSSYFS
jgi:hypothetical protein